MSSVRVDGLTVWYRTDRVLDSVSLSADRGSALGLVGPSGSGKSTTLKAIGGVLATPPARQQGGIWIDDREVTSLPAERRDAPLVFQQLHLFEMSVEENVVFGLRYRAIARVDALRRAQAVMDRLGILELRSRSVAALSGGER